VLRAELDQRQRLVVVWFAARPTGSVRVGSFGVVHKLDQPRWVVPSDVQGGVPVGRRAVAVDAYRDSIGYDQDGGNLGTVPLSAVGVGGGSRCGLCYPVATGLVACGTLSLDKRLPQGRVVLGIPGRGAEVLPLLAADMSESVISHLVNSAIVGQSYDRAIAQYEHVYPCGVPPDDAYRAGWGRARSKVVPRCDSVDCVGQRFGKVKAGLGNEGTKLTAESFGIPSTIPDTRLGMGCAV